MTYLAFYLLGKGATEASWYAVPSSVALLLAAEPAWPAALRAPSPRVVLAAGLLLVVVSVGLVQRRAPLLASYVEGYGRLATALNGEPAARPAIEHPALVGEIGVFGFLSDHPVIDVGALVSPEVLPLKNRGLSLLTIARETGARWLVISDEAVTHNRYPTLGEVWADEDERAWLERCPLVARARDKRLYRLVDQEPPQAR